VLNNGKNNRSIFLEKLAKKFEKTALTHPDEYSIMTKCVKFKDAL